MFWGQQNLGDPQSLNAYSYAEGNPITGSDPKGLFNVVSGTIQKGDTLNGIAKQINGLFGTSYTAASLATKNGISNPNQIQAGGFISYSPFSSSGGSSYSSVSSSGGGASYSVGSGSSGSHASSFSNTLLGGIGIGGISNINKYPFGDLPGQTLICRGGDCSPGSFANGTGVVQESDGTLSGVSVQVGKNGETAEELLQQLPARFGGVGKITTLEEFTQAGGKLVQQGNDAGHGLMSGLSEEEFTNLFYSSLESEGL